MTETRSDASATRHRRWSPNKQEARDATRRLAIAPAPLLGENIHGYVRRLADANGHACLDTFLYALGFRGRVGPTSRDQAWARLARWTGYPATAFDGMRWRPATSDARLALTVLDTPITRALLYPSSMRFCPECLRSDGIRRDLWSLAQVVACPVHRCLLVDSCPACGDRFRAAPVGSPVACVCGLRFDGARTAAAPSPATRVARNLALLIGARAGAGMPKLDWALELPPPFSGVGVNDYMAYLDLIGTAATTAVDDDPRAEGLTRRYSLGAATAQQPVETVLAQLEAATAIIDRWPGAFHDLLDDLRARGDGMQAQDLASAFPTRVGRSLLRPRRGTDGLPLRLACEAVDGYWRLRGPSRLRKRNLTVENTDALRLHALLNAKSLAVAAGGRQATNLHARILRRVLDELSPIERALPPRKVADLALRRGVARHAAVSKAITGHAAARILEGRETKGTLSGWDHPDLLPADPALQGLRFRNSRIYSPESVDGILARIGAACALPTDTRELLPLFPVAIRVAPLRPWYDKTALLLDVLNGTVPVFATTADPRLNDLLVDLPSLRARVAGQNPALFSEYASLARVNEILQLRLGSDTVISLEAARRLVRTKAVGFVLMKSATAHRKRPVVRRLYNVADMMAAVGRSPEGPAIECDAGACIATLRREGATLRATARALAQLGLRTINGARWTHSSVGAALASMEAGYRVCAIATSALGLEANDANGGESRDSIRQLPMGRIDGQDTSDDSLLIALKTCSVSDAPFT